MDAVRWEFGFVVVALLAPLLMLFCGKFKLDCLSFNLCGFGVSVIVSVTVGEDPPPTPTRSPAAFVSEFMMPPAGILVACCRSGLVGHEAEYLTFVCLCVVYMESMWTSSLLLLVLSNLLYLTSCGEVTWSFFSKIALKSVTDLENVCLLLTLSLFSLSFFIYPLSRPHSLGLGGYIYRSIYVCTKSQY